MANSPTEPVAVWIRYTVHKSPGEPAAGSIWATLFEPGGPRAGKVTDDDLRTDDTDLLSVGQYGAIRLDGASGSLGVDHGDMAWDLRFDPTDAELRHLPYEWMYRAPLPRTKSTSPSPAMRVTGTVTVADRQLDLNGWPGMLGHNWGAEHAHRWIWLRGASFTEHPEAWLDVVIGRIKVGRRVLPWIANGAVMLDGPGGRRFRVGGLGHVVRVLERDDGCDLVLPGRDLSLTVKVNAPLAGSVGWEYSDPEGGKHQVRNCSTAGLNVEVRGKHSAKGTSDQQLTTTHGGVYELGAAELDPAVVMQPYRDG